MENKNPNYILCLKCNKKIYTDEIKFADNNSKVICPHCNCKMLVDADNPLTETKILKILGEE
jgi:DNA-directed RNA polymerase subunit RPC12/RpoP